MTRAELKERVRRRLLQFLPIPGEAGFVGDPFTLDGWVTEVTDEIARRTYCNFKTVTSSLVTGQREYCIPDNQAYTDSEDATQYIPELIEADCIEIILEGETCRRMMRQMTPTQFDQYGAGTYMRGSNVQTGTPCVAVVAPPKVELYPAPDYTLAAALIIRGWYMPGKSWRLATDNFPLQRSAEDVAVAGIAMRWAEAEAHNPRMAAQAGILRAQYEKGIRILYGQNARMGQ